MQVCVQCQAPFGVKRLGVWVIETAGEPIRPFRIWRADLFQCPICGREILGRFSHEPVTETQDDFEATLAAASNGDRFVVYSPEALAMRVRYETKNVRSHVSN